MSLLEVNNLKKIYKTRFGGQEVEALRDVSFGVEEGEYVAIMGESGSGKTTLLNILAALDKATAGKIVLKGMDLSGISEKDIATFRRDNLGFVFQEFNLLDTFSIEDNIFLPLVLAGKDYKFMKEKLDPIAERLGISEILKSRINTPLVWGVLLLTLVLTVLFYFSQKQQFEIHSRYCETLSEYKFLESRVMRKMEQIRVRPEYDPTLLMSSLRSLRETAVSLYEASESARMIEWMPPEKDFAKFEESVLAWVASVRRYESLRVNWLLDAKALARDLNRWNLVAAEPFVLGLDSARFGYAVTVNDSLLGTVPDSLAKRVRNLLDRNEELAAIWSRIDNDQSLVRCENLLQAFKMQTLKNREVKFWIQQVFYLVSIVLLLFTLFFVIRSRK